METMPSHTSHRTITQKRRNGMLQSCEPCRKRKLSCDHQLPTCARCIRRGTATACVYHPAPMTGTASKKARLTPAASNILSPPIMPQQETAKTTIPIDSRKPAILSVPSAGILMDSSTDPKLFHVGFLGETSADAVVAELNSSLGIVTPAPSITDPQSVLPALAVKAHGDIGVEVLSFFVQNFPHLQRWVDRWFDSMGGGVYIMFRPLYRVWLAGIVDFVERSQQDPSFDVETACLQIWQNTQQPLRHTADMSARQWAAQATGDHLRWETLGVVMFIVCALGACLPKWDSIFHEEPVWDKDRLVKKMLEMVNKIIELCNKCGSRNDMTMCLIYQRIVAIALVHGDSCSEAWTALGQACDTAVLMGLHLEIKLDGQLPFFLYESRIRQFNVCYSMDKFLSTFLGRPPHISYRYSVIQEPHDLTEDEICSDWPDVQAALSRLNENGWAAPGTPSRSAWRKIGFLRQVIREDVLEVVIGSQVHDMEARIANIRAREKEALDAMPEFVRINPEHLVANLQRGQFLMPGRDVPWRSIDVMSYFATHTSMRQAEMLMERAVINRRPGSDPTRLIAAAGRLLSLTLLTWTMKEFLFEYQVDMVDCLAFYAVPPAGILAMEMLKREQRNDPYDDFPRSETLQQLSVLVPMLESVQLHHGNASICTMGLTAIRKVLDRLLSKPRYPTVLDAGGHHGFLDDTQFANIGNDADFLQWLGSVDFDATSWLDHPSSYPPSTDLAVEGAATV